MAVDLSKLSDAELEAISSGNLASLSDATLKMISGEAAPAPSTFEVVKEAARKGLAGLPRFLAGASALVGESAAGRGLPELFMPSAQPSGQPPTQLFSQAQQPVQQALMGVLGGTGVQPQTTGQKLLSAGVTAATSPESYLFPPIAAVRRLGLLGQLALKLAAWVVSTLGAKLVRLALGNFSAVCLAAGELRF